MSLCAPMGAQWSTFSGGQFGQVPPKPHKCPHLGPCDTCWGVHPPGTTEVCMHVHFPRCPKGCLNSAEQKGGLNAHTQG